MLTTEKRQELIGQIRQLPQSLADLVGKLSDEQLDTPYGEGKWTIRQVVHHLADSHCNGLARFRWVLTEEYPTLKPYDQDRWARLVDARTLPLEPSLAILRGLHERWVILLESLSEDSWFRKGNHPEEGDVSIEDLLVAYANHGIKHLGHINGLLEVRGW